MGIVQIRGTQIQDGGITRPDINTVTSGVALITKILTGSTTGIKYQSFTGVDAGTGDVMLAVDQTYLNANLTFIKKITGLGANAAVLSDYWTSSGIGITSPTTGSSNYPTTNGFALSFTSGYGASTESYGRNFDLFKAKDTNNFYLRTFNGTTGAANTWDRIVTESSMPSLNYLPLSGGTLTGNLNLNAVTSGTSSEFLILGSNGLIQKKSSTVFYDEVGGGTVKSIDYIATGGETSFVKSELINNVLALVVRSGLGYEIITSGIPDDSEVLFTTSTGTVAFITPLETGEPVTIFVKNTSPITSGSTSPYSAPRQIFNEVLVSTGWSLVAGFYEYTWTNQYPTTKSIVDFIPHNASVEIIKVAEILPLTTSTTGSVKLYAKNAPTGNITVNVIITESL